MSISKYNKIRLITVVIIAIVFSRAIIMNNFILPMAVLAVSWGVLFFLRRKVKGVIADERDYAMAGKSALLAIQLFSMVATIVMLFLFSARETNVIYEPVAMTLAFSVCALMFIYSIIFKIRMKKEEGDEK